MAAWPCACHYSVYDAVIWVNEDACLLASTFAVESSVSSNIRLVNVKVWLAVWLSGNTLASINVVALRQTRLVLGWVTVCGRVNHLGM